MLMSLEWGAREGKGTREQGKVPKGTIEKERKDSNNGFKLKIKSMNSKREGSEAKSAEQTCCSYAPKKKTCIHK